MYDDAALADAARACLLAGIRAADARALTRAALSARTVRAAPEKVRVIAVGKAAATMLAGAYDALGDRIAGGVAIVLSSSGSLPGGISEYAGGHPMPNAEGERGAAAAKAVAEAGSETQLLVLISGGASALMTIPPDGVSLDGVLVTARALMEAGATIRELNCVRKHVDQLKGGQLARAAGGSPVRALVLSDVIGDPLDVIGSGILSPDPTTYLDAIGVLRSRGVWEKAPRDVRAHLERGVRGEIAETPKAGDRCFAGVDIEIVGNSAIAMNGAAAEAEARGFSVSLLDRPVEGEAREAGAAFARHSLALVREQRMRCVIGAGETTVTVTGTGIGGRNLEFAAAAALAIEGARGIVIGSVGTDGRDGPTDAAGAVVDGDSAARARSAGADLESALDANDTLRALEAAGDVVRTGETGTNVMDLCVGMVGM